jgi:hypothetical protein
MYGIKSLWTLGWLKLSVGGLQIESDFHEFTSTSTRYRTLSLQTVTFRKNYCAAVAEKS